MNILFTIYLTDLRTVFIYSQSGNHP